ncbi:MAG: DUF1996 domain-containing protein [Gemmatimonadaceae bacterium]
MQASNRLLLSCGFGLLIAAASCGGRDGGATDPGGETPFVDAPEPAWTFCTNAGAPCEFTGLRTVRLGPANGPYVQKEAYHAIPCASYGFDDQDPAPGQSLHCDYGPMKTDTVENPSPGMAGLRARVIVPLGSPGVAGQQVGPAPDSPERTDGSGAFRTTCSLARLAFDDPIVYPGRPGAAHLHMFFGNAAITASTTPQSIASTGNSTCRGGTLNRTGYWVPALFDTRYTPDAKVVPPEEATFYYKTGYNMDPTTIRTFPAGLRMIAGNKDAAGSQFGISWSCRSPDGSFGEEQATIPANCAAGDWVRLTVIFPQCWDGVNVDSPDHKSHVAYPVYRNPPQRSGCPASHPVPLPEITEHFDWLTKDTRAPAFWRLSSDMYATTEPGGLSAHADWMNGWDPETMRTIVTQCLNRGVDCGVGSIGNGTTLF